jgi:hypothetical protein
MTISDAALIPRAAPGADAPDDVPFTFDDRQWRARGLEQQLRGERLRVTLQISRGTRFHVDTLDLYVARQRRMFLQEAAAELHVDEGVLKDDLGRVLRELETRQETLRRRMRAAREPEVPAMTEAACREARELLQDPRLIERILADYEACGLVGEETSKLVCYLACTSRLLPQPLSVLIQSSSAAGKTSLLEATLALMPPEAVHRMSSLTGQALYYMGTRQLKHTILAVAEEAGVAEAAYALKLLQSDGRLRIATVGKDSGTGRLVTQHYEVEGPVAMLLTTTAERPDEELANRCLVVSANEHPRQTEAIHRRQRLLFQQAITAAGQTLGARHQNAQRLLQPLPVTIPWADRLTFRTDQVRHRRDHAKYLALIASIALLHQHQRHQVRQNGGGGAETPCVVASLEDLELANQLATAVLGEPVDSLLPATRHLWIELTQWVTQRARRQGVDASEVRFTQRELREALQRSDRALRRHLTRLVELEYVVVQRTGRGNLRAYQVVCSGDPATRGPSPLGLVDVEQLRASVTSREPGGLPPPG